MTTLNKHSMGVSTAQTVADLKAREQDFEWYPTTAAMIQTIKRHLLKHHRCHDDDRKTRADLLDCGAGDGRVLDSLADYGEKYAIEKSSLLIGQQSNDVIPVGTDFYQATLIDKKVDVVFSNPPYSDYEAWATKIIREANAPDAYLIIPARWKQSTAITEALAARRAESTVIGSDDFLNADRAARATVDILHINLVGEYRRSSRYRHREERPVVDPFAVWFEATFPKPEPEDKDKAATKDTLDAKVKTAMVDGKNLIESLVLLYQRDMQRLSHNYQAACRLDPEVMRELEGIIEGRHSLIATLKGALKQRIKGLKHLYWHEFFSHYASITERLTTGSRKSMLNTLHSNVNVDFSADNAYAVTLWVIRNANQYYDQQLIELVESMTRKANVVLYQSNQRTFKHEEWRYSRYASERIPDHMNRYQLEYRIVLERTGGISTSGFSWENERYNGLDERAADFINDILAVAQTLGWNSHDTALQRGHFPREWESRKKQVFVCENGQTLMEVRAYQNGNMHIKFAQPFMRKLNVEFGRLKGWLKDHHQAAEELKIKPEEAADYFDTTFKLSAATSKLLLASPGVDISQLPEEEEEEEEEEEPAAQQEQAAEVVEDTDKVVVEASGYVPLPDGSEQMQLIAV